MLQHSSVSNLLRFQERAVDLVTGPDVREAFYLHRQLPRRETDMAGTRWDRTRSGSAADRRRRAVGQRHGLDRRPSGEKFNNVQTWDMHGGGLGGIFDKGNIAWAGHCRTRTKSFGAAN